MEEKLTRFGHLSRLAIVCLLVVGFAVGVMARTGSAATPYPARAVDVIVPFAPGGPTDLVARITSAYLSKKWGVPLNVVNKPGGSTVVASSAMLTSRPDGYTILTHSLAVTLAPAVQTGAPYKWDDPTPLGLVMSIGMVFTVPADSPWKTLKEAVEGIKQKPEAIKLGTGGAASPGLFTVAKLLQASGIDPAKPGRVIFDGDAPMLAAMAGGNVAFGAPVISAAIPMIAAGKIRPLAVTTANREPRLPDVPTASEVGYPGYLSVTWNGFSGPPKLPEAVVRKWAEGLAGLTQDPESVKKFQDMTAVVTYKNPAELKKFWEEEYTSARSIAEKLRIRK